MADLSEKDFIHDDLKKNPSPAWFWLFVVIVVAFFLWGLGAVYRSDIRSQISHSPFLQVTNREMSVFLWQFPEKMRAHIKTGKASYLPGFQFLDSVNIEPGFADRYVEAPPELLFLYHTWKRLISLDYSPRPISPKEFSEFLAYCPEWLPVNWRKAPKAYVNLVDSLPNTSEDHLQNFSEEALPLAVRQSFQGWKNYMKEGEAINALIPTSEQMSDFLRKYPQYARNYWRNLYPHYLRNWEIGSGSGGIGLDEMTSFLQVALYNYTLTKPSS